MDGGAAIEVLVQNLINALREEYSLLRGLDEDSQKLQRTLIMIMAYLSDAQKKFITQDAVKIWLRELEALAFDADNVLDKLSYRLLSKKVKKMKTPTAKDKVLSCFSSFSRVSRRHNMAYTIKQINAEFESMNKRATDLGLQSMIVNAPDAAAVVSFETDSLSLDPIFIGRDDDVPKLVDMLTPIHQDRIFSMVALVGMGGMGKTTLTRKVFNHERVKARFGSLIWVHVSQTFDPISLFNKIYSTLTSNTGDRVEIKEVILKRLREVLKSKTYLIVLDNVWNEDVPKWEDFINSISGVTSTKGNGIIITTRSKKVASIVNSLEYDLSGLSDDDCWSIIKAKAFDGNGEVPSRVEIIGRKIAERCRGLPLAANVVGGVLRYKSEEEWRFIAENWLSDGEGGENISRILKFSYDHLSSPSLKKCFAYCSVFPKGYIGMKQELIELWMAEGFLQQSQINDMESVGNMFYNVFLQMSLLQVARKDDYGNVERFVMHDLVHDLASSVLSSNANESPNTIVRYMFLEKGSIPIPKEVAKHVRTLFLRGGTSGAMISDFKCLHNLTLTSGDYKELPNSIKELIHLRNLNISYTGKLPDWIGELHHLQTLRTISWKLPNTLKYLINLRHLYIRQDAELPADIGRLTSLQTLPYFTVGEEKGYRIEELGSLEHLKGTLGIQHLERVRDKEEALEANIFQKPNLFELVFEWSDGREDVRNDESVLEGLQPHANLKKLKIYGFKGKIFPTWSGKMAVHDELQGSCVPLGNVIEIRLYRCSEIEEIPAMEHLANLESLTLWELKKVRFINSSFCKNLKSLRIEKFEALECLGEDLFHNNHNLSKLRIKKCSVLRELPDGLDTLESLEELIITDCPKLKSIGNPSVGAGQCQGILSWVRIIGCGELVEFPCQMLESWAPTIATIDLEGLRSLENLPVLIDCLAKSSRLKRLRIVGVPNFKATGSVKRWGLASLEKLNIDVSVEWSRENSGAIQYAVDGILQGCCNSLYELILKGVEDWEWLPQSVQHLTTLHRLELKNVGVEELPQWFENLSSLFELCLLGCNKLRRLPSVDALRRLARLNQLVIKDCAELSIDPEWRDHPNLTIYVDDLHI